MALVDVCCCLLSAQHVGQPYTTCWETLLNMLINLAQHVVQISIDWIREVCHLGRMAYCAGRGRSLRGYREIAAVAPLRTLSECET